MTQADAERIGRLMRRIAGAIADYRDGKWTLGRLVVAVESAIDALSELGDASLVEQMSAAWTEIEVIYALMLDDGRSTLNSGEHQDLEHALDQLKSLAV